MNQNKLIQYEFLPEKYFKATPNFLDIKSGTPFEDWEKLGSHLKKIGGAVQLWLGDWMNWGEKAYGEKYSQALDGTHYEKHTLENYASIAKRTENTRKNLPPVGSLFLRHWDIIASLSESEQVKWAKKALENNWTIGELRKAMPESSAKEKELEELECKNKCPKCGYEW